MAVSVWARDVIKGLRKGVVIVLNIQHIILDSALDTTVLEEMPFGRQAV